MGGFERFLLDIDRTNEKKAVVDQFLESIDEFPLIEGEDRVHFIYRGPVEDVALAGDIIGARIEQPMTRVAGTDLFYYSTELEPEARVNYHFIRDYEEVTDPRNPRETVTELYGPDMEVVFVEAPMPVSWVSMPRWVPPAHLAAPPPEVERGHLVSHEFESQILESSVSFRRTCLLATRKRISSIRSRTTTMAALRSTLAVFRRVSTISWGVSVQPLIAVFIERPPAGLAPYAEMWANELVPFIDTLYRTIASAEGRASLGMGWSARPALHAALTRPEMVHKVSVQSLVAISEGARAALAQLVQTASEQPINFYIDWGRYDLRAPVENWDLRQWTREFSEIVESNGYPVAGGEALDGTGWSSWRNRTDEVLRSLFPLD